MALTRSEADRREAFEQVFRSSYWPVRDYVRRRAPSGIADDVLAETFLTAWRRFDDLDDRPSLPWLLGVARRSLANQLRSERRRGALREHLQATLVAPDPAWELPATMSPELADALAQLSEREREALLLVAWEELEPADAARVLGCSAATFRVRLHRARRRVARALGGAAVDERPQLTEEVV